MTTEQMALVKKLIQKHEIEATDAEWTLIFMGVGYGLSEQQIDSYLVMNTTDLLAKKRKDVMEIRRCIEFYEMMQQKGKQENVKKSRRANK